MTATKKIRPSIRNALGGTAQAFSFTGAALLGLTAVLIRGVLGILAVEGERAKRRLSKPKALLLRTNSLPKKEIA